MKTLLVYDNEGYVISETRGSYRIPVGLPYLEVDVPSGKRVASGVGVDVSANPHVPIFEDIPKSETDLLREELQSTQLALAELAETILGGI